MRLRYVIPAAIAAAATYAALVRDEALIGAPTPVAGPVSPPPAPKPRAGVAPPPVRPEPPAAPVSPYADLMPSGRPEETGPSVYDLLAGSPRDAEPAAAPPAPDPRQEQIVPEAVDPDVEELVLEEPPFDPPAPPVAAAPVIVEPEPVESPEIPVQESSVAPDALGEEPVAQEPDLAEEQAFAEDATVTEDEGTVAPAAAWWAPADPGAGDPADVATDDPWETPLDEGRFALGGWAAAAGHTTVSAVTFRRRLPQDVQTDQIFLEIDASENVPLGGLVILSDPGFAPDRDGFTLLLEAAEAGSFSAAGSYRVLPADWSDRVG